MKLNTSTFTHIWESLKQLCSEGSNPEKVKQVNNQSAKKSFLHSAELSGETKLHRSTFWQVTKPMLLSRTVANSRCQPWSEAGPDPIQLQRSTSGAAT